MTAELPDPRLEQIVESVLQISRGDFSVSLTPSRERDDLDAIIVGIRSMAIRLSATYDELEKRVRQRTALLEAARDRLEVLAYTDALTSLANRPALLRELAARLDGIRRGEPPVTLFLLDLDGFKPINDIHGHSAGDKVLQEIARRLVSSLRPQDMAARLGGDEFAVLVQADTASARALGQRLLQVLNSPIQVGPAVITAGCSIGFCLGIESFTAEDWLECADTAMYVAKRDPNHKLRNFADYMLQERHRRAALSAELATALSDGQIAPIYQPVIRLEDQQPVAVEALARWNHPTLGVLPPAIFLPLLEKAGLLNQLTRRLLDDALRDLARWRAQSAVDDDFRVQVNVKPKELRDLSFPDLVTELLRWHNVPAHALIIEVTEEDFISGDKLDMYSFIALRELGVRVYIDDFGAGYASFGYLSKLPIAGIKIDRTITTGVDSNKQQRAVMKSVIDLAATCGLECIVEGVETPEQARTLSEVGANLVQGYLYGWPGPFTSSNKVPNK
ncbi:putative bifunctional diguanylate cyclase/phosphodiesterase [Glutamicibacter uratoxydans]|uniref:putative bifunctional diguanylate cyclase/phosphodiesterase n=1 Tax=Glutamicibacter uratoxydans TaxID=43667 RepID=UPI003D6E9544